MDAICPEDYSMAVWSQPITAIMGSVMKGKRGVTGRFALWKELFYFQFSLKFSPLQWQSLSSGAHLTLMGTVCLLSRAASWWQPDWSDAATALPGEAELCAVLVVAVAEEVTVVCKLVCVACPGRERCDTCRHVLYACCMLGCAHPLYHWILSAAMWGRYCHLPYLVEEATVWGREIVNSLPGWHGGVLTPQACLPCREFRKGKRGDGERAEKEDRTGGSSLDKLSKGSGGEWNKGALFWVCRLWHTWAFSPPMGRRQERSSQILWNIMKGLGGSLGRDLLASLPALRNRGVKIQESFISVRGALLFFKVSPVAVFLLTFRFFFSSTFLSTGSQTLGKVLPFLC